MLGQNSILPPEYGKGDYLKIHSIFDTIQGEGPYAGTPSVFIRLAGCNLACAFCDTDFDTFNLLSVEQIISTVLSYCQNHKKLITITGGEPFRQPIEELCNRLLDLDLKIQIETNGLLYRKIPKAVEIVCSPKNNGNGYQPIRPDILEHTIAIKFLVSASDALYNQVPKIKNLPSTIKIYIQPIDTGSQQKNQANTELAIQLVAEHNAILSLQLHKILGIA